MESAQPVCTILPGSQKTPFGQVNVQSSASIGDTDVYEYAFDLGAKVERPAEDLGAGDYIEHMRLTAPGGFN